MKINFEKQVVLVTGAGRGLGASYANMFAESGATVVVNDAGVKRDGTGGDPEPASFVARDIQAKGGTALVDTLNLSSEESCNTLIDKIIENFGRIDVLVHSAGLVVYKGIENTTSEEWEQMRSVNIDAPFWLTRAAWPVMKRQKYGRIVLTVSGHGLKTFDDSDVTAYGIGKGAQFGLMNGLASEGKKHGILVNAISPVAATRIFRRDHVANKYPPESVASGVVVLGSDVWPFTGKILGAAGDRFTISENHLMKEVYLDSHATPEEVLKAII